MKYIVFLYGLVLIVLFAVTFAVCLAQYFSRKSKLFLWLALMFGTYILDGMFLYMSELLDFSLYESTSHIMEPVLRSVLLAVNIFCYRMVIAYSADAPLGKVEYAAWAAFGVFAFVFPLFPFNPFGRWFYAIMMTLPILWSLFAGIYRLHKKPNPTKDENLLKGFMVVFLLLQIPSFMEEAIRLATGRFPAQFSEMIGERRITVELASIFFAVLVLWYVYAHLKTVAAQPQPVPLAVSEEELRKFSEKHELTSREREVLPLLLERKTNQEIGEQLFISAGTVKSHVHNIYVKADVNKRSELYRKVHR